MSENQNIPAIEMRGVSVAAMRDASFTVVEDVNWSVAAGEFWVIAGQEHSGKTDLLMLAASAPWIAVSPVARRAAIENAIAIRWSEPESISAPCNCWLPGTSMPSS